MPRNKDLTNLREVLTGLFWQRDDARTVALDTGGLDLASIDWTNRPRSLWQSVLDDAESRGGVPDIIKHARIRYPENQSLKLAEENQLHLAVWAQDIPDQDWQGPTSGASLEKLMGRVSTLRPIWFLEKWLSKARSVCRVVLADVVACVSDRRLQYLTDTLGGSSGAPVFDVTWSVVAVHFGGDNIREPDTSRVVFCNEGTHINRAIEGLQGKGLT